MSRPYEVSDSMKCGECSEEMEWHGNDWYCPFCDHRQPDPNDPEVIAERQADERFEIGRGN